MNEIENQLKKIEKEKLKLKNLKLKIAKEKFEKVFNIIANNFDLLNENLKSDLKIYYENETKLEKKTTNKNNKNDKNIDNI